MGLVGAMTAGLALAAPSGPAEIAYMHGNAIWSARADGSGAHVLVAPLPRRPWK